MNTLNTNPSFTFSTVALHWTRLVPYGEWPKRGLGGKLQVFSQKSAEALCEDFFKQAALGHEVPIYVGHPDDPQLTGQPEHQDPEIYGYVVQLHAQEDGLWAQLAWKAAGWAFFEKNTYRALSVRWELQPTDFLENNLAPIRLQSVGLTNKPNIANAHPIVMKDQMMELPPKIQQLLKLPAQCDAQTFEETLEELFELAQQDTESAQSFYRLATERQHALQAQQEQLMQLEEELASCHQERINNALNLALLQGRIPGHQAQLWRERLEADFQKGMSALAALNTPFSTRSLELSKGLARIGSPDRHELIRSAQERAKRSGERLTLAWTRLAGEKFRAG